ncbi:MAG: polysaccharide deacetylase family protein [Patescibacteria group bacterium]
MKHTLFILALVLLAANATPALAAANLISNPSLEAGTTIPTGWSKVVWPTTNKATFTYPSAASLGTRGAKISVTTYKSGDIFWMPLTAAVTANTEYTWSGQSKSTVPVTIVATYTRSSGGNAYETLGTVPATTTWATFSKKIKTPANTTGVRIQHVIRAVGTLEIDNYSLVLGAPATSTPPPPPPPAAPTLTLSASPLSIIAGATSTLVWASTNATSCAASNGWGGGKTLAGSEIVSPLATTTYVLACAGAGGTMTQQVIIGVTPAVPPPPPPPSEWTEGMVTLSFDDAWRSQYINALPILQASGLKGTFYILTEGIQGGWDDYMTPSMVQAIATAGHNIEGHTITHRDLASLSSSQIDQEIKNSKSYIESLTGTVVRSLAYPYGSYNTQVIGRAQAAGYTNARTADPTVPFGFNTKDTPKYELNSFSPTTGVSVTAMKAAIDQAKANKQWFIFSFHEIENGNSDEYATTLVRFQEIINYIKLVGIKTVTVQEGVALMTP